MQVLQVLLRHSLATPQSSFLCWIHAAFELTIQVVHRSSLRPCRSSYFILPCFSHRITILGIGRPSHVSESHLLGLTMSGAGGLVTRGVENAEVPSAFFTSVFTSTCVQQSKVLENVWSKEGVFLVGGDRIREH